MLIHLGLGVGARREGGGVPHNLILLVKNRKILGIIFFWDAMLIHWGLGVGAGREGG